MSNVQNPETKLFALTDRSKDELKDLSLGDLIGVVRRAYWDQKAAYGRLRALSSAGHQGKAMDSDYLDLYEREADCRFAVLIQSVAQYEAALALIEPVEDGLRLRQSLEGR